MPSSKPATFKPALILHGGAGNLHRSTLPPELYAQYHASLLSYLRSTKDLLNEGASALDAAVHAVSLMEDDPLFNCGRGSVFTSAGTIEMEASVMVTTVNPDDDSQAAIKRGVGVMGLRNVRHPIRLARESLLRAGYDPNGKPNGDGGNMHSQLVAPHVEELAREWGLEFKPDEWFFSQRRWDEHLRGLKGEKEPISMSQGTVGCVCLDQWGNLAVATSTGGMTNKAPGRIGDTPTLGAGFWAETWDVQHPVKHAEKMLYQPPSSILGSTTNTGSVWDMTLADCMPSFLKGILSTPNSHAQLSHKHEKQPLHRPHHKKRRAVALSGTGNGDSFLRVAAARTACAMLRFSSPRSFPTTLAEAVTAIVGPGGELQQSAGKRWNITGEGSGGIIGIEIETEVGEDTVFGEQKKGLQRGKVVFDFNSGGMWRAWVEEDSNGKEIERVMVFREEYQ